jgi:hypothetical protein
LDIARAFDKTEPDLEQVDCRLSSTRSSWEDGSSRSLSAEVPKASWALSVSARNRVSGSSQINQSDSLERLNHRVS